VGKFGAPDDRWQLFEVPLTFPGAAEWPVYLSNSDLSLLNLILYLRGIGFNYKWRIINLAMSDKMRGIGGGSRRTAPWGKKLRFARLTTVVGLKTICSDRLT
jgi:hypothetical protein